MGKRGNTKKKRNHGISDIQALTFFSAFYFCSLSRHFKAVNQVGCEGGEFVGFLKLLPVHGKTENLSKHSC